MDYIGIDVSKDTFHVASNDEKVDVFANNKKGISSFEDILHLRHGKKTTKIGFEATGIYHLLLAVLLTDHGWNVFVINPYITSKAINTSLRHVKNDKKDARTIRSAVMAGHGYQFTDTLEILELKALLREYAVITKFKAQCKNLIHVQNIYQQTTEEHFESVFPDLCISLEKNVKQMKSRFKVMKKDDQKLLQSIPGIGPICSAALVASIGNIHRFSSPQKLVAYIGMDCRVHESGTSVHGKGFLTKRGDRKLRSLLFNAASVARRCNPDLQKFYEKKISEGKHYFSAVCAVERKLIHLIYAVWKRGTPYEKRS